MEEQKEASAIIVIRSSLDSTTTWTSSDENRIRKRMDIRLMPVVFALYLLCFIDRSNIGNARILGMTEDLHLKGYRFNWALTSYFIAWAVIAIPSNVILARVGGKFWMSSLVMAFGVVTLCSAFLKSYGSMVAVRFILGITEGGVLPGLAFYLSLFYRKRELASRVASFMVGASLAGAFGGLLAAGLSQVPTWGVAGMLMDKWRNIFFFEGMLSMLVGFIAMFFLPSHPDQFMALSERDRKIATLRIQDDSQENSVERFTRQHLTRGVFNINNNIFGFGFCCATLSAISLSVFIPTLLKALGWGPIKANLLSVPPFATAAVYTIVVSYLSDRFMKRGVFAILSACVSAVGFAILVSPVSHSIKYMATFFACCGCFALGPNYICWTLNNAVGPTAKAVSVAYIIAWSLLGTLIALWSYLPKDSPDYVRGNATNLGANCLNIFIAIAGILYCSRENSMRDRGARDHRLDGLTKEDESKLGYRHPQFRYTT